ncbi:unnamed protein product [Merluccius merluccius]
MSSFCIPPSDKKFSKSAKDRDTRGALRYKLHATLFGGGDRRDKPPLLPTRTGETQRNKEEKWIYSQKESRRRYLAALGPARRRLGRIPGVRP